MKTLLFIIFSLLGLVSIFTASLAISTIQAVGFAFAAVLLILMTGKEVIIS